MSFTSNGETKKYNNIRKIKYSINIKAAGDKLLMNKFIRQNFGGGLTLKNFRS